jgi:hypothetical protein
MRGTLLVVFVAGLAGGSGALQAQSMVETAAAAAGGSAGGIAGKKVSDGLSKIFEKVDKHTAEAAKGADATKSRRAVPDAPPPLLQVGPGVPQSDGSNVPPPPPIRHAAVRKTAPVERHMPAIEPAPVVAVQPPAPDVTAADLKRVTAGMLRDEVLKLGSPAARITMVDDGHLLEIYRYQANETTLGVVRLTDGAVSNVVVR